MCFYCRVGEERDSSNTDCTVLTSSQLDSAFLQRGALERYCRFDDP